MFDIEVDAADRVDVPKLAVEQAGDGSPQTLLLLVNAVRFLEAADFERCWKVGCLAGFLVGQAAAKRMVNAGRGTILFTGATAALRGSANFANLAVPKFGLRALAQSMARELHPQGIHVAHFVIDGAIRAPGRQEPDDAPDSMLDPDAIAQAYLQVLRQPRNAWSTEVELRPWTETF